MKRGEEEVAFGPPPPHKTWGFTGTAVECLCGFPHQTKRASQGQLMQRAATIASPPATEQREVLYTFNY